MTFFKKILAAGFIILVVAFGFWYQFGTKEKTAGNIRPDTEKASSQVAPEPEIQKTEPIVKPPETKVVEKKELPESILIDVPFLVQAPNGIWDALHEDACEEASLLMVKYSLDKKPVITLAEGEKAIQDMVKFETKNGYGLSVTMQELAEIAESYYSLKNARVETDSTIQDIKEELAAGRPVIVPAAGKILPNPNFKNGGPNYHMLVVVGYDQNGFITNDPGTKKGEGFRYSFEDLYYAIHDWDEVNILNGQKAYLVFDEPA